MSSAAVRPSVLLLVALAFLAVEAHVVHQFEGEVYNPAQVASAIQPILENMRQGRQQQTTTVTVLRTTTISSVKTESLTTKKVCASIVAGTVAAGEFAAAPAAACRRKRQFWNEPVYIGFKEGNDDLSIQYVKLSPSQVFNFEPTLLPQFRNTDVKQISGGAELVKETPSIIEPSFEKSPQNVRVASPVFNNGLSSFISSIVSNILTTTTTTTTFVTVYTSTTTSTSFSATSSYFIVGNCFPSGILTC